MPDARKMLVAFGANVKTAEMSLAQTVRAAAHALASPAVAVTAISRLFASPCFPAGAGPDYVNAAALLAVDAGLDASDLLARLHQIEAMFGRSRTRRWGMRTLDIDLIALGDAVLPDAATQARWRTLDPARQGLETPDGLILPHPRMQDRAFVLVPLADVAPHWRHPLLGLTVDQMIAALPAADLASMQPI